MTGPGHVATDIVGRDDEFGQALRTLAEGGSVLLEGPAGIGKTALWRALVARLRDDGALVLAAAPTETEAALPLAGLADLLRPLTGAVADLPEPQRRAAEAVLLQIQPTEEAMDERALGAAVRTLLDGAVAAGAPVVVAVDDAPWLDPPSERALRFAVRRVPGAATLVSHRTTGPAPAPLGLDRDDVRLTRIELAPLGVGSLHRLLRERLGTTLSRPLLTRVAREAGGVPLLAIELARAATRLPHPPRPSDELPVVASMRELLSGSLAALPDNGRDALRLAALLAVPRPADLAAAGVRPADLDPAEEAGLVTVTETTVEFAHPMYASVLRAETPAGERRRLHGLLAGLVTDPDERARHLAHGTVAPDEAVAAEVTRSAGRLRRRGAPELAAELFDRAGELTPSATAAGVEAGQRRRLEALRCRFDAGAYEAARTGARALAGDATGELRAEALLLCAAVAWNVDDASGPAVAAAGDALASVPPESPLAGRIHAHLSMFYDAPADAIPHAEAACALLAGARDRAGTSAPRAPGVSVDDLSDGRRGAGRDDDRALLSASLLELFIQEVRAGRPARTVLLDDALALEDDGPSWLSGTVPAVWWKAVDDHDRARDRLATMLRRAQSVDDEPSQHEALMHLGEAELSAGRWDAAGRHIAAARELGEQLGTGMVGEDWLAAMLDAHRGRLSEAATAAEAGLRRAAETDDSWARRIHLGLAAFTALCAGRSADAVAHYRDMSAQLEQTGLVEPLAQRFEPDWIEACVAVGDLDGAAAVLHRLSERHRRLPRPWTRLGLARSTVLLRSAAGDDLAPALDDLTAARAEGAADTVPLDRARCLLIAGIALRRAKRRRDARTALTGAAAEFAALGAAAFEERARAELARIGGRPAAPRTLTATEERVARLAAAGQTNRLIAEALFVSPKTVESNLARVYQKLGIGSRAELGAAMARHAEPPSA